MRKLQAIGKKQTKEKKKKPNALLIASNRLYGERFCEETFINHGRSLQYQGFVTARLWSFCFLVSHQQNKEKNTRQADERVNIYRHYNVNDYRNEPVLDNYNYIYKKKV